MHQGFTTQGQGKFNPCLHYTITSAMDDNMAISFGAGGDKVHLHPNKQKDNQVFHITEHHGKYLFTSANGKVL